MMQWCTLSDGTPRISAYTLYFSKLESAYIVQPIASIYLCWNFSGGPRKTFLFLQVWRYSHLRSSKVNDIGANWKRMYNFLLVFNSKLGPILHHFGDFARFLCCWPQPYSMVILGVFPLHQIAHVGVSEYISLMLFGRQIILEELEPMWSRYLNITDGQTDRQTTCNFITALCMASRSNNNSYQGSWE